MDFPQTWSTVVTRDRRRKYLFLAARLDKIILGQCGGGGDNAIPCGMM